ncbi:EI24 domain-containing protein [Clostridium sp. C2-6-12]|uniref:EI24 domain-containing protein n=1 Tax=Clostridium sp. C2-6-12 TaxID=2698832 RepID=UPI00137051A9|nr:EI24 domain-containing protein [Clostridium sp. C2-6-12]
MEVILEQFIPSDKPKRISNTLKNVAIIFGILAIMTIFNIPVIGIVLAVVAVILFLGSYMMYVDFEYELYNGDITVTKVYNASRRKIAEKINKDNVKRVYLTQRNNELKNGATAYFNTNIKGLNIYTFELNNNKVLQLALNEEMEKIVKIIYVQKMTR